MAMAVRRSKSTIKIDETEPGADEEVPFNPRVVNIRDGGHMEGLYVIGKELGRGKFGRVCQCQEVQTKCQLAAKFIEVRRPQEREEVLNEIEVMRSLQHPRLLQLYDAFESRGEMVLILELITGGELFERVIDDEFVLTEKVCTIFMRQICEGVAFMHEQNVLHLDMKPENILCVTRTGNRVKLIDFGLARKHDADKPAKVMFGTPEFVAPEVVNFEEIGPPTDIWSVGVICYILLSGLSPFMGDNDAETLANVTSADYDYDDESFDSITSDAKDFMSKALIKCKEERMTARDCLEHKWLRRMDSDRAIIAQAATDKQLSKANLRHYVIRRRWHKVVHGIIALRRMGAQI